MIAKVEGEHETGKAEPALAVGQDSTLV